MPVYRYFEYLIVYFLKQSYHFFVCVCVYIYKRIKLSKSVLFIQAKRFGCDSVFRRFSLLNPGRVESSYRNCCMHVTSPIYSVELIETELLTEVTQKFRQYILLYILISIVSSRRISASINTSMFSKTGYCESLRFIPKQKI